MSDSKIIPILKKLVERGWTPLRSMSSLLGYAHPVQIYQRQKGNNPINVIRIGGTNRVYEDEVLRVLKHTDFKHADAELILSMYQQIKGKQHGNE